MNSTKENSLAHSAISRRAFFQHAAAPVAVAALSQRSWAGVFAAPQSKMGIASTSFMGAEISSGPPQQGAAAARPRARDAYEFLEKCYALGAGGIQTQLNGDLTKLRARADELGMYIEGMASIPRTSDTAAFERSLADAKAAGALAVRVAMLSGRRYESFPTLAAWKAWVDQSHEALQRALPIIEKYKVTVAVENHKDWTLEDMQRLFRTYSSEYLGICLDFGNNIALLDDPMEVIETLAPYARSTHIKDMGVQPYEDGFLLSEVQLGAGLLDLPRIVSVLQKANPKIKFSLEMITRDPLKVPCMTDAYWAVFPERNGKYLARTFRLVRERGSRTPLPTVSNLNREERARVEEENIKTCFAYVSAKQLIA
ncbi:MAG: TIM barrel protein [Acidobacteriota bacterium]